MQPFVINKIRPLERDEPLYSFLLHSVCWYFLTSVYSDAQSWLSVRVLGCQKLQITA